MAVLTAAQLLAEIAANLPDNTTGAVTPALVRGVNADIVSSIMPTAPVVAGNLARFSGTTGLLQDSGISAAGGAISAPGPVVSTSPIGGVGYGTGAGGAVTQPTSKSTTVTLNAVAGEITMNNAALAAGAIVTFGVINSASGANDVLVLNQVAGTRGGYTLNAWCQAGSIAIDVRNNTAGSLSEAIVIRFALIKGSAT